MYQNNPFNPYQINPAYASQFYGNSHSVNPNQIVKVNGRGGAEAYQMPPNSQTLLLDETQPIVWLKQTDGAGYPSLNPYDIKPHEETPTPNIKSLEDRIARIEEIINHEPNFTNNNKQNAGSITGKANGANDEILRKSSNND